MEAINTHILEGEVPGVLDANGSRQKKTIVNDIKKTVKKTQQSEQSEVNATHHYVCKMFC